MEMALKFINTKIHSEMYLKTQNVPHSKHKFSVIKPVS